MFTGIIEEVGEVREVRSQGHNHDLRIQARMAPELRVDQSVAHNGVCLTVVEIAGDTYRVTAVEETLRRSNLGLLKAGDHVNLERSLRIGDRLDGHMVQGHVDTVVECTAMEERDGSWLASFRLPSEKQLLVQKGSVCLNGVSLTIAGSGDQSFTVAIIPYTFGHTIFGHLKEGDQVNVEFDVLGKYVQRMMSSSTAS